MGTGTDIEIDNDFRHTVNLVMFAILAGDEQAVWELHRLAEPSLIVMVRREASRVGVWLNADDTFDLTLDAAIEMARIARSWSPDGALPWVWARKRIHALVQQQLGTFTRELDDDVRQLEAPPRSIPMQEPVAVLRSLAQRHDGARELQQRLDLLVTSRDAGIWLAFQVERNGGNRAPAVNVAAEHDMRPDAVRKVVQRVTERLASADSGVAA